MKFFNIDLHVAVIEDLKHLFHELGHEVVSWNLSNHCHHLGVNRKENGIITQGNWRGLDQELARVFQVHYRPMLDEFDGFICCYPVTFAWLYEMFDKPIICYAPIRYEEPFGNDPDRWARFNTFCRDRVDKGQMILAANSLYDAMYMESFVGRPVTYIPSWCGGYLSGEAYQPCVGELGVSWKTNPYSPFKSLASGNFDYLTRFAALAHIPYNVSIMKYFEQYVLNIPLWFPSKAFLETLLRKNHCLAMKDWSFNRLHGWGSASRISPAIPADVDLNNYMSVDAVMRYADLFDFYNTEEFAGLNYFDSFDDLREKVLRPDFAQTMQAVSNDVMVPRNIQRHSDILSAWGEILRKLA